MAVSLNTGVPWIMCKQEDAPDPLVSTFDTVLFSIFLMEENYSLSHHYLGEFSLVVKDRSIHIIFAVYP